MASIVNVSVALLAGTRTSPAYPRIHPHRCNPATATRCQLADWARCVWAVDKRCGGSGEEAVIYDGLSGEPGSDNPVNWQGGTT